MKELEDHYKQIGTDQDTRQNRIISKNNLTEATNLIRKTNTEIQKFSEL